jgi:energy-converting hydrogenase Eha subunit A
MLPMLYLGINKVSVKYIGNHQIYIASAALLIIFRKFKTTYSRDVWSHETKFTFH